MKKIKILYTIPNFDTAGSGKALCFSYSKNAILLMNNNFSTEKKYRS
jgi:hypothetical protein